MFGRGLTVRTAVERVYDIRIYAVFLLEFGRSDAADDRRKCFFGECAGDIEDVFVTVQYTHIDLDDFVAVGGFFGNDEVKRFGVVKIGLDVRDDARSVAVGGKGELIRRVSKVD